MNKLHFCLVGCEIIPQNKLVKTLEVSLYLLKIELLDTFLSYLKDSQILDHLP